MLVVCTETTARVLAERRLRAARLLTERMGISADADPLHLLRAAADALGDRPHDVRFSLIFLGAGEALQSVASSGLTESERAIAEPLARQHLATVQLGHGGDRDVGTAIGPMLPLPQLLRVDAAPESFVAALSTADQPQPFGFVVFGVTASLPFDAAYRAHLEDLALTLSIAYKRRQADAALESSNALLRIAGTVARIGGWTLDLPDQKLTWSDNTFRLHDLTPGTPLTLERAIEFYPPEYRNEVTRYVRLCATEGIPFDFQHELITAKQRRLWVNAIGEAVRDADGRIVRLQGAFQDISEQKAAEEKAHRTSERLANTLESITDSFFTLDRDWRFTYVNVEAERVLGRNRSTLLGRSLWEAYPEAVGSTFDQEYRSAVATNTTSTFEEYYPPLGIWFGVKAYPTTEGLAVYFRDVTERRRLHDALRASESRFRQLAESNILGLLLWNAQGDISYANDAFLRMVGYTREELAAGEVDWRNMTPPDYLVQDERALAEIAASGSCLPFEKEYVHKDGHRVAVLLGAAALDGATDHGICYVVDISKQKRAVAALSDSEERFRLLAKATNDAIWDWNLITNELWWNEGYETLFGYTRAEVDPTIRSWMDNIHPRRCDPRDGSHPSRHQPRR